MALPLLPGLSRDRNIGKEKFHKSQHWGFCNNVAMLVNENKPGVGGKPLPGQKLTPKYSVFPEGMGSDAPPWVAFDKQVLSFDAYFDEEVPDKNQELYRIRHCKIYFYLEDDTIQVIEPRVKNSGIPQGTIVRRHRIPLPPPCEDQFYTIDHFNINIEVTFYARKYKITDCDQFTKNFLRKMGVRLNPPTSRPDDPYTQERQKTLDSMTPFRPYERIDTLKQFLEHDGHVLRFFCVWDDPQSMFHDPRELVLHYYLSDDTIDIKEIVPINSGRDAVPLFLRRDKLPKHAPMGLYQPGTITDRTVLNVLGNLVGNKGRYILDNRKTGAVHQEFYKDSDLKIGAVINVWGRKIILCDCDEFTKEYYRTKYGIEDFTPVPYKAPPPPKPEKTFPPYTGFGSEEDSLCSCMGLILKPPAKDFKKFLEKDRIGMESNILRFLAKLITDSPIDKDRKLIISYFLSDDTISVFEHVQRNSGIHGGKFLERGRIKKPGQELFKSEPSEYFKAQDLFVGARVCFHGHNFLLVDADEYTLNYMEKHANEFSVADVGVILKKLKVITKPHSWEIRQLFAATDPDHNKVIEYDAFRNLIVSITGEAFSDHEMMTLGRYYGVKDEREIDLHYLLAVAQEQLKKNRFENFEQLTAVLQYNDREKCGVLPREVCRTICKSFKLPLADDDLQALLTMSEDDDKQVEYKKFVDGLNWRENPIPVFQTIKNEDDWTRQPPIFRVKEIKYLPLLDDLFGKEE
ncbi:EF-hand domain-containing family member C2 isoform X1 [Pezoporus wallicus]|uniref:EF-hand domain-containing family member C2 isoform X1 n=1 Tax=Pezoporus wallicus TaxID=35540 RepID=UPI00254ADCCE|nr:EF-hand domain-containing family member C2 isoform X1 [Pezoporus wallicus]XP_061309413.1 EF-hand domain-containing family member C2 isoform X1 [Pezoporus flaviventris]